MNVLLSCAGRRSYLVEWFRQAVAPGGRVIAVNSEPLTSAMVVADAGHVAPPVASDGYVPFLLDVCRREDVGLLVPLLDLELPALAAARGRFAAAGVFAAVSAPDVVARCADKLATATEVPTSGVLRTTATTLDADEAAGWLADGAAETVFVKPRCGTSSILTTSTTEPDEVAVLARKAHRELAGTQLGAGDVVLQAGAPGVEHGLTICDDFDGGCRAVLTVRKLAMRAGETDAAEVVDDPVLDAAGRELAAAWRHVGAMDVDVFLDGGEVWVVDANARIGGGYPFSHLAGADLPRAYVAWARGDDVGDDVFAVRPGTIGAKAIAPLRLAP